MKRQADRRRRTRGRLPVVAILAGAGILSATILPVAATAQAAQTTSDELRLLFEADQSDRRPASPPTPAQWEEITRRDHERRDRVMALVDADLLSSGEDFYHAAMVLQHGQGSEDILMSHIFATAAAYLGDERGRWLSAAALDRYLLRTQAPQRLGTQYIKSDPDDPFKIDSTQPWSQGPYDARLPDSVRKIFGVETRAEQAERVKELNRGN